MPLLLWTWLVLVCVWSSVPGLSAVRSGRGRDPAKAQDLQHPGGAQFDHTDPRNPRTEERGPAAAQGPDDTAASLDPELDFLVDFAGKKRLWVITAPSHSDNYLRMMEKQLQDTEQDGLNCRLAERDTLVLTIIQNAMMEGTLLRTTLQGEATMESLDPDTVTKMLHYLELTAQDQVFSMLILKKNLRVSERFPYPVRVAAVLEIIDQLPMRKLEKMTRKGSPLKCKVTRKRVVRKKVIVSDAGRPMKRKVLSPQRQGNLTLSAPLLRRTPPQDKKEALKSKIQDILNGRSRFVIKKTPPAGGPVGGQGWRTNSVGEGNQSGQAAKTSGGGGRSGGGGEATAAEKNKEKTEDGGRREGEHQEKKSSKSKGKGKKEGGKKKKGKGRGKKSSRATGEKDKQAMKEFMEALKGNRRLLVVTSPSSSSTQYVQQRENNDLHHCDLALRKVTMVTILGSGHSATLNLQHYQLDSEPAFSSLPEQFSDPDLISQLRSEFKLSSQDFSMSITDYDLKSTRVLTAPPAPPALLEYIDSFRSRRLEKERERKTPVVCSKTQQQTGPHNALDRFISKRRLLILSTPAEDDYSYQQQLQALSGQACHMGIRHFALLKLVGSGASASGSVEFFPLNGRSQSEVEPVAGAVAESLRDQLKINRSYFSMLVVGKDGEVRAWFPSPLWSLDSVYDLVDSMELRLQEQRLQRTLGISCPDDTSRGGTAGGEAGGGGYRGYEEEAEDGYLYRTDK